MKNLVCHYQAARFSSFGAFAFELLSPYSPAAAIKLWAVLRMSLDLVSPSAHAAWLKQVHWEMVPPSRSCYFGQLTDWVLSIDLVPSRDAALSTVHFTTIRVPEVQY